MLQCFTDHSHIYNTMPILQASTWKNVLFGSKRLKAEPNQTLTFSWVGPFEIAVSLSHSQWPSTRPKKKQSLTHGLTKEPRPQPRYFTYLPLDVFPAKKRESEGDTEREITLASKRERERVCYLSVSVNGAHIGFCGGFTNSICTRYHRK